MPSELLGSRLARLYLCAVITVGTSVSLVSVFQLWVTPAPRQWIVLAALTILTGSFTLQIPRLGARISVSDAFVFASVFLFGPPTATVIVALDCAVISFWGKRPLLQSVFNLSATSIAIWVASQAFYSLTGLEPGGALVLTKLTWPLFVLAGLYFVVNSWLVAFALAFEKRVHVARLWWDNFPWLSLNCFGGVSVAALLVSYTRSVDLTAISIILPLLIISYLTYRTSLGRVDDAHRHVEQVNDLYMSTIETLAMAVDAKDQITHGHIRRVQVFALELARRIGINDQEQLRAIAAAALLHDMGKLAIPEHILNKPGKLTAAEFEKMKQHADIGADLLSSIKFPYPVVPIVRHHHENWNGHGYPSGIAGPDIPLGARILAVVDCFDALTSDRPYRPRLSVEEAFTILRERSGTMYDPLVVDTFLNNYVDIAPSALRAGKEARTLFDATSLSMSAEDTPLAHIRASASQASLLAECQRTLSRAVGPDDALRAASQCLRQLTPAIVYALYRYNSRTDSLNCDHSVGDPSQLLPGLTVRVGERVSGWCAANRRTALNSHATLDLANIGDLFAPPLRSVISTPLVHGDQLLGVLSAYSATEDVFTNEDQYVFEQVASALVSTLMNMGPSHSISNVVSFGSHRH